MTSSSSTNSLILSLKLLLISATVVSVAVTMKLAVPVMVSFAVNGLPAIWSVVATWLKPPYLYVVINGIIITIAASTRFQNNHQAVNTPNGSPPADLISDGVTEITAVSYDINTSVTVEPPVVVVSKQSNVDLETVAVAVAVTGPAVVGGYEDELIPSGSTWNQSQSVVDASPPQENIQPEFNFPVKEKLPVTSRFANNRKPAKANPEGARALRVLKPKKHETLESTWKMITDGRQLPLTRHLRKSDTFDYSSEESIPVVKRKVVKKSETFKERTTYANQNEYPGGEKLKKDVSLGQDELNRRVEAFIKKFNDDMRLQRQESLRQYMDMVNNGAR